MKYNVTHHLLTPLRILPVFSKVYFIGQPDDGPSAKESTTAIFEENNAFYDDKRLDACYNEFQLSRIYHQDIWNTFVKLCCLI